MVLFLGTVGVEMPAQVDLLSKVVLFHHLIRLLLTISSVFSKGKSKAIWGDQMLKRAR